MIAANNPSLRSWISVPEGSDFPIQNLPFGVFRTSGSTVRVGTRIGDTVIDLSILTESSQLAVDGFTTEDFSQEFLNPMMKKGKEATRRLRQALSDLFSIENQAAAANESIKKALFTVNEVDMCMPVQIGDYTDFYSSKEHATNVGIMFRDPANALLPNWLWIPVGYHGRSSSVIISGQDIHRPKGQIKPDDNEPPIFGPCRLMDFELEMAFFLGGPLNALGDSISIDKAHEHIFGCVLMNDWSARDIQVCTYFSERLKSKLQ